MPRSRRGSKEKDVKDLKNILPGATRRRSDADLRPGEPASDLGDRHAAGTPGGGTEFGGLGGTNVGDAAPENANLEAAMGTGVEPPDPADEEGPFGGISGGAVGGTPAEKRSTGGKTEHGLSPDGVHRGDSTVGTNPEPGA
jgi:hypothetical protein